MRWRLLLSALHGPRIRALEFFQENTAQSQNLTFTQTSIFFKTVPNAGAIRSVELSAQGVKVGLAARNIEKLEGLI
ncbi:hypothetical protein, partial [Rhizobium leguminosarum]|uniref:hypothetical protein n=1 Tax=Rhizobium leguminosarum TaxID=384 RepID=UPI003F9E2BF8